MSHNFDVTQIKIEKSMPDDSTYNQHWRIGRVDTIAQDGQVGEFPGQVPFYAKSPSKGYICTN